MKKNDSNEMSMGEWMSLIYRRNADNWLAMVALVAVTNRHLRDQCSLGEALHSNNSQICSTQMMLQFYPLVV